MKTRHERLTSYAIAVYPLEL